MNPEKQKDLSQILGVYLLFAIIIFSLLFLVWNGLFGGYLIQDRQEMEFRFKHQIIANHLHQQFDAISIQLVQFEHTTTQISVSKFGSTRNLLTQGNQGRAVDFIVRVPHDSSQDYQLTTFSVSKDLVNQVAADIIAVKEDLLEHGRIVRLQRNGTDLSLILRAVKHLDVDPKESSILIGGIVLNKNYALLEFLRNTVFTDEIAIIESGDIIVSTTLVEGEVQQIIREALQNFLPGSVHHVKKLVVGVQPLSVDGEQTSFSVFVGDSDKYLIELQRADILRVIFLLIFILLFFILVLFLVKKRVAQALDPLVTYSYGVAANVPEMDYQPGQIQEFNALGHHMVTMVNSLKSSEAELQTTKSYLDNVVNAMPSILIGIDQGGHILSVNTQAEDFLKLPSAQLIGSDINTVFPKELLDIFPEVIHELEKMPADKNSMVVKQTIRAHCGHSSECYLNLTGYPLMMSTENGIVIRLDDVTDQVRMKEQILALNRDLEGKVEERTGELNQSLDNLKKTQKDLIRSERLAGLGNMVTGIAHEINTPLGIGVTESSFLLEKSEEIRTAYKNDGLTEKQFEKFVSNTAMSSSSILQNLTRAAELVNSFKQVAVDQTIDDQRSFKLLEYLEGLLLTLRPIIKKNNLQVQINGDPDLEIYSYPGAFSQILTNFINNSVLHGMEGRDTCEVDCNIQLEKNTLLLEYRDNGVGMEKDVSKQVFDPFFTTKRNQGGTGLGLNIVYNIVTQKLGGKIECHSIPQQGVRFVIQIPQRRHRYP